MSKTLRPPRMLLSWRTSTNAILETLLIFLVFLAVNGQLAPDVNESHYLTKAKHFWNQEWCPGDLFLNSSFSHWLFYFCFGWLTKFVSLSTFAWIGRIGTWLGMAWAWRRLSWRLLPFPLLATFNVIVFLLLNERFHLAGEWVVGGFEAKGIAYIFVTLALGDMIAGKWKRVWPWLGGAAAFHVLVGGWAMLAVGIAWLIQKPFSSRSVAKQLPREFLVQLPWLLLGFALLALGAIPPLLADQNASVESLSAAKLIYVNQRISHHLTFAGFPTAHVARFVFLMLIWVVVYRRLDRQPDLDGATRSSLRALFHFGVGSLLISFGGLMLSGIAESDEAWQVFAAGMLRFYWFRLADFAIPASTALAIGWLAGTWIVDKRHRARQLCAGVAIAAMVAAVLLLAIAKQTDSRPIADRRSLPNYPDDPIRTRQTFENWTKVCQWIADNTPVDAVFITPAEQQTFKWYAGRTEVVNWKDVPQDAEAMVEWRRRVSELLEPQKRFEAGLMSYSDEQLRAMGAKYGADYLMLPQWQFDLTSESTEFRQVYPVHGEKKATYVVLKL